MTIYLSQSTASQEIPLGIFVDSVDGNSEEAALTIANTDIKIWKAGATTLASKNSGGATYISNGVYYAVLDATDTDTLGSMVIFVHVAGALAVRLECLVVTAAAYSFMTANTIAADLTTIDDLLDTEIAAIKAKTDALPSDPADASDIAASFATVNTKLDTIDDLLDTEIGALTTAVADIPTNAELATALATADDAVLAAIAALNNLSAAAVNAEVVDALATDTYAEPGAVPASTTTLAVKIGWLFALARNRLTQDATTLTLRNDANNADIATSTVSDDGTTTVRGEWA